MAGKVEILNSKVNTMAAHSNALEKDLIILNGHNLSGRVASLEGHVGTPSAENVTLNGRVDTLSAKIASLEGKIVSLESAINVTLNDQVQERRYKACKEIAFGIQDLNLEKSWENNSFVMRKGLSSTFKSLRDRRHYAAYFFRTDDSPDTLLFKKGAFLHILNISDCLRDELVKKGITSEVINVVVQELKKDLKAVSSPTPIQAEVDEVDDVFRYTLMTFNKEGIQHL